MQKTNSGSLNRAGTAELLFLKTLWTIHQKWRELKIWEVIGCESTCAVLATSRIFLQWLLICVTLDAGDLFCWCKQKNGFCKLWQQHKELKTTKKNETWPDIYDKDIYNMIRISQWSERHSRTNAEFWRNKEIQKRMTASATFKNISR